MCVCARVRVCLSAIIVAAAADTATANTEPKRCCHHRHHYHCGAIAIALNVDENLIRFSPDEFRSNNYDSMTWLKSHSIHGAVV